MRRPVAVAAVIALVAVTAAALWWARRPPQVVPAAQAGTAACRAAAARYPATLGLLTREPLDVAAAARYGDPAVVVRCGVPAVGPTSDECVAVDDVDWLVHPLSDGTRLTTYGRSPAIEVLVPADHGAAPLLVPALGDAAEALPTNGRRCLG